LEQLGHVNRVNHKSEKLYFKVSQVMEETGETLELNDWNVHAQRMYYLILK
jgi:hypothetical protein